MTEHTTFIDAAITDIATGSSKYAGLATMVQKQPFPSAVERIGIMLFVVRRAKKEAANSGNEYDGYKPGQLLQFIQRIQNKICWSARRVVKSAADEDAKDVSNGMDFSQDFLDAIGMDPCDTENVRDLVDADFADLSSLQLWLASQMGDFGQTVEPLSYYRQNALNEATNEWYVAYEASNFDDAMSICDDIAVSLQENSEEVEYNRATSQLAALASGKVRMARAVDAA